MYNIEFTKEDVPNIMNASNHHREIERILFALRTRDLNQDEWARLDELAMDDEFLREALEGLKQISPESRIAHISSILDRLSHDKRKKRTITGIPVWMAAAASVFVVVGVFWIMNRIFWKNENQFAQNTPIEENLDGNALSDSSIPEARYNPMEDVLVDPSNQAGTSSASEASKALPGSAENEKDEISSAPTIETSHKQAEPDISRTASPLDVMSTRKSESARSSRESEPMVIIEENNDATKDLIPAPPPEVRGIVMNDSGEPLPGAQVQLMGTMKQTQTDYLGNFALDVPYESSGNSLVITHAGYPPLETKAADGDSLVVRLQESTLAGKSGVITLTQKRMGNASRPATRALAMPVSGERSYNKYLSQNLRYPREAASAKIHGMVILEFDISSDGTPYEFRIIKSLGYGCDEEAIRLIREGAKWNTSEAQVSIGRWNIKF